MIARRLLPGRELEAHRLDPAPARPRSSCPVLIGVRGFGRLGTGAGPERILMPRRLRLMQRASARVVRYFLVRGARRRRMKRPHACLRANTNASAHRAGPRWTAAAVKRRRWWRWRRQQRRLRRRSRGGGSVGAARERVVIRRKMQARCNRANKNYPTRARKARTRFKGGGRRFAVGPMARSARVVSLSLSSSKHKTKC